MNQLRIVLQIVIVLALLAVPGYFVYRHYFAPRADSALEAGESAYDKGTRAYEAKDFATAAVRFDEAAIHAQKAVDSAQAEIKANREPTEQFKQRMVASVANARWLKARALRDAAYARAAAENNPLPLTPDAAAGSSFRDIVQIRDPKVRQEAVQCLELAATSLEDISVQRMALQLALRREPLAWANVQRLAQNLVRLDPKDSRAYYLLARFDYEQPRANKGNVIVPVPPQDRSRARVLDAREHLHNAKKAPNYQIWRTLHLEAQIHQWLMWQYAREGKNSQATQEAQALRSLLLDDAHGALTKAQRGEGLERIGTWDVEGIFGVHEIAIDLVLAEARQHQKKATADLQTIVNRTLDFCQKCPELNPDLTAERAANTAVYATSAAQPYLAVERPDEWKKALATTESLVKRAGSSANLANYGRMAELLVHESHREGRAGRPERSAQLTKEALHWIEEGLKAGQARKAPPTALIDLHGLAARIKSVTGAKREELAPHIAALRESKAPRAELVARLTEGIADAREGRLERARQQLEFVAASGEESTSGRAHPILANIYMAVGQPERALASLREVERSIAVVDKLAGPEKAWALEFTGSAEEVTSLIIVAQLDIARARLRNYRLQNPKDAKEPADLVSGLENDAVRRLKTLKAGTNPERTARQALVEFYAFTDQRDKAKSQLALMQKDYPDHVGLLQLELALRIQDMQASAKAGPELRPSTIEAVDQRIKQFLQDFPREKTAKLLWASWLTRTQRADQAVAYLENPANFVGEKDNTYAGVLAQALLQKGDHEEMRRVLQHLPHTPAADAALILAAATAEERRKQLGEALARYESDGLFRCWSASLDLNVGDHEKAARGYFSALDFTRVKTWAQTGLRRSLFTLALSDPRKVSTMALAMLQDYPEEPNLMLAFAFASLLLDDLGDRADEWEKAKNMTTALKAWERTLSPRDRVKGCLTKAEFWTLANRVDLAHTEVLRALSYDPGNPEVLVAAIGFKLQAPDPSRLSEARNYVAHLRSIRSENPQLWHWQAQIEENEGRFNDAIQTYRAIVEKYPTQGAAYLRLVLLLQRQGDKEKTMEVIQQWRKWIPDDIAAVQRQVKALAEADRIAEARKLADDFVAAQMALATKKLDAAAAPKDTDPTKFAKQKQDALENVRRTLQLEMARAFASSEQTRSDGEAIMRKLLNERPDSVAVQTLLADTLLEREAWAEARDAYQKLWEKHKIGAAANNLAWLLAVKLDDPVAAHKIAQEARLGRFSKKPVSGDRLPPEFLDTLGEIYVKLQRADLLPEMRDLFEAARQRYARDPRMCLYLGYAYLGLKQTPKAEQMLAAAVDLANSDTARITPLQREKVLREAQLLQQQLPQKSKGAAKEKPAK